MTRAELHGSALVPDAQAAVFPSAPRVHLPKLVDGKAVPSARSYFRNVPLEVLHGNRIRGVLGAPDAKLPEVICPPCKHLAAPGEGEIVEGACRDPRYVGHTGNAAWFPLHHKREVSPALAPHEDLAPICESERVHPARGYLDDLDAFEDRPRNDDVPLLELAAALTILVATPCVHLPGVIHADAVPSADGSLDNCNVAEASNNAWLWNILVVPVPQCRPRIPSP
mmetsp:Transcript_34724/g.82355  ORF Transcript_34724/g.82355 Transcript_34724/m.82355 type:complete len:225 (+) Transcript_34724:1178-1852(+)